jgi:hypothetical protein
LGKRHPKKRDAELPTEIAGHWRLKGRHGVGTWNEHDGCRRSLPERPVSGSLPQIGRWTHSRCVFRQLFSGLGWCRVGQGRCYVHPRTSGWVHRVPSERGSFGRHADVFSHFAPRARRGINDVAS